MKFSSGMFACAFIWLMSCCHSCVCHVNTFVWWTLVTPKLPLRATCHWCIPITWCVTQLICSWTELLRFDILLRGCRALGALRRCIITPGGRATMNSYLDYSVYNRGPNSLNSKVGCFGLDQDYMPSACGGNNNNCIADGRSVGGSSFTSTLHESPGMNFPHQPQSQPCHINLDLVTAGQANYSKQNRSHMDYGHQAILNHGEQPMYLQSPSFSVLNIGNATGTGTESNCRPAELPVHQYPPYSYGEKDQQHHYTYNKYSGFIPSECESKKSPNQAQTFDWMKVKRNPPKTGLWKTTHVSFYTV